MSFLRKLHSLSRQYNFTRLAHSYVQGQSSEPNTREYFYYIDHQGQLFLDDAKRKNFTSCFKEKQFLKFFYSRLERNTTGRYAEDFPYLSLCGRERNFVRCEDLPIVFTELTRTDESVNDKAGGDRLLYAGGTLHVPFEPSRVMMLPDTGRVYHSGPVRTGGVGLVKSSLAIELSRLLQFEDGNTPIPTHLTWRDQTYKLSNEISAQLKECHRLLPLRALHE